MAWSQDPDEERDFQLEKIWDFLDGKYDDDPDFHLTNSDRYQLDRELEKRSRNRQGH